MKKFLIAGFALLVGTVVLHAQDAPQMPGAEKEHDWLKQLVVEWEMESEMVSGPGQPSQKIKGIESVRTVGGLWIIAEIKGDTPMGTPMAAVLTLGFDPQKKKYVGTWIDSHLNHLWLYEGTIDPTGKILTLETEGPDMKDMTKRAKYRDVLEIKSKDHKVLTSSTLGEDGKWLTFNTASYRRKS